MVTDITFIQITISCATIAYFLYLGGRAYQSACDDFHINTLLTGLPLGLALLSITTWFTLTACGILHLPSSASTILTPLFGVLIWKAAVKKGGKIEFGKENLSLAMMALAALTLTYVSSLQISKPSIDHDISLYLGYASDILENISERNLPILWQHSSDFKIPHNNLYVSVLAWTNSITGDLSPANDQLARSIPLISISTLIISLLAFSNRISGPIGVLTSCIFFAAMPNLYYVFTAHSVDGFYLMGLPAILHLIRTNKENTAQFSILIGFMAASHNIGLIYASMLLFMVFLKQPGTHKVYTPAAIAFMTGVLVTGITYYANEDLGFHYKYYTDAFIQQLYFGENSSWRKSISIQLLIDSIFQNFKILSLLILGAIVAYTFNSEGKAPDTKTLATLIATSCFALMMTLYLSSKLGQFTSIGNAFVSNFRYSFGVQILTIVSATLVLAQSLQKIKYGKLALLHVLIAGALLTETYHLARTIKSEKFLYSAQEEVIWKQRQAVCEKSQELGNIKIFTDNIAINYQCSKNFIFTYSQIGSIELKSADKSIALITSNFSRVWEESGFFKNSEFELANPESNSYDKIFIRK